MLVGVLLLGLALAVSYRAEATRRGLAQGRSEAVLMAQTAIEPQLNGLALVGGLNSGETNDMNRVVNTAVRSRFVLRLRLRDLAGEIIYANDDLSLVAQTTDDNRDMVPILGAAHGVVFAQISRLNDDSNDSTAKDPLAVEVFVPLRAGHPRQLVGVMEVYLPYAPIQADVEAGINGLYRNLAVGLALLYALLVGISFAVGRRLRRQIKVNEYLADFDALTGLPNRTQFQHLVALEVERCARSGQRAMLAIVDLDRFKEVNDTLGHQNGDRLLVALGARMAAHFAGLGSVARLGGNEFGILLSDAHEPHEMLVELRTIIQNEISVDDLRLSIESSIGFAMTPEDATNTDVLLQLADTAMLSAKTHHLGVVRYDPSQSRFDVSNLALIAELRDAIDEDQFVINYQPKVRIRDGSIDAVEALVRWRHPTLGLLGPDRFMPLVERTDLIDQLTDWIVRRVLKELSQFGPGADNLVVAVNVSSRSLNRVGFANKVVAAMDAAHVEHSRLLIEVTETVLMSDPVRACAVLVELERMGVRLSVDDFGSGQTSLSYLSTLPVHELKIDRSFVSDMVEDFTHAAIVNSIVELGHNLGFSVVGEGVETLAVLKALAATGCEIAQGYFFARPMAVEDLADWLGRYIPVGAFDFA
jgi:diguanylate cyclase (GGDEF)-like protein